MKTLPFTYAVFYNTIIAPNTLVSQKNVNWILFIGEPTVSDTHPEYFSTTIGNGYASGNKTIRKTLVSSVNNLSDEELLRRIQLIALQDVPAVFEKLLLLIEILDISPGLKDSLLAESTQMDMELFLGKVFQMSIKGNNLKLKMTDSLRESLCGDFMHVIEDPLPQTEVPAQKSTDTSADIPVSDEVTDTSAQTADTSQGPEITWDTLDYSSPAFYEDLKKLLHYTPSAFNIFEELTAPHIYYQELLLPRDFKLFLQFAEPIIFDTGIINVDMADIYSACNIDLEHKICTDGTPQIMNIVCPANDFSLLESAIQHIGTTEAVLTAITFDEDGTLDKMETINSIVQDHVGPDSYVIMGINSFSAEEGFCRIQLLWNTPDATEEANEADHAKIEDNTSSKKTEIEIPSFMAK